jgi:hypothetical protein
MELKNIINISNNEINISNNEININEFCKTDNYNLLEIYIIKKNYSKIRGISIIQNKFEFTFNLIPLITSILNIPYKLEICKKYCNISNITEIPIIKKALSSNLIKKLNLENYNIQNTFINERIKSYSKKEINNCIIDITNETSPNNNTLLVNKTYDLGVNNINMLSFLCSYYTVNKNTPDIKLNELNECIEINYIWNIDNNIRFYITLTINDTNDNNINENSEIFNNITYMSKFVIVKNNSKTLNKYENKLIIKYLTSIMNILNF